MSEPYEQLLDATIQHLQELKSRGVKSVNVSPEALVSLRSTAPAGTGTGRTAAPGTAPSPVNRVAPAAVPVKATVVPSQPTGEIDLVPSAKPVSTLTPASAPLDPAAKAGAMRELRERALVCVKCPHLANSRQNVVFGVG